MSAKFYRCNICGNLIVMLNDSGVKPACCGKTMEELVPNTVDASNEKHVPVVTQIDENHIKVEVGSVAHPMLPEHHITMIYLETEDGGKFERLTDKPEAVFCTEGSKPVAVYEYCNLHGLWMTKL